MSKAPTPGRFGKRSWWVRGALGACAVLAAIAAATWLATPWYVRNRLLPDLWAQYGLTMTAERQDLSIADGTAELHGVRLLDGDEEVLTAKRMEVRVSLRGLYEGRTVVERLVFDDPVVHARLEADGRTNVGKILERRRHSQAAPRPATLWKEVLVHGGTVECDDRARGVSSASSTSRPPSSTWRRAAESAGPVRADHHRREARAAEARARAAVDRPLDDLVG